MPCGPINDFAQVFADPHVRERGMEIKVNHPFEPALSLIRNPITFSGTPVKDYRAPPLLGPTPGKCWRPSAMTTQSSMR